MKKYFIAVLLLILPFAYSHIDDTIISADGKCKDFMINIESDLEGCWDVKIDAPGHIITEEGPIDTFFYVNNAMCNGAAEIKAKFSMPNDINARLKLRQNSTILEKDFFVSQQCPKELSTEMAFVAAVIIILILLGLAIWYMRRK